MSKKTLKEHQIYLLMIFFMGLVYILVRFFALGESLFGFEQLKHIPFRMVFVIYALILLLILLAPQIERMRQKFGAIDQGQFLIAIVIAAVSAWIFFLFRNEFINQDGEKFIRKFVVSIPDMGYHASHDEMWELYLHSRVWDYANRFLGWSVAYSYQVVSSIAGGMFVFLLIYFSKYFKGRAIYFSLGVLSSGFMQLFFGDVENYTLVSVLLFYYFFVSKGYIEGKYSFILPVITLATAITFHLLAGWLLPSLLILFWQAYKRREYREMAYSIFFSMLILGSTLIFFHYNGLTMDQLFNNSHALGHGGTVRMLVTPSFAHYWQIANMLFLLFPAILFFIPMFLYKRIRLTTYQLFLSISSLCMLLLMFIWNPMLGVYQDWNLFAPGMIPLAILFWSNFVNIENLKFRAQIYVGTILLSALHSYAWIISNHYL
jgi:hypothetical protein